MKTRWLVTSFLLAVVLANLAVAEFGQVALVFTAWVLIPLDMLVRDVLHDRWRGRQLGLRMAGLIGLGALIAVVSNPAAAGVVTASVVAFGLSMAVNAVVFEVLARHGAGRMLRMNGSNALAAVVDSIAFPMLAFGTVTFELTVAQAGSKFLGGLFWSYIAVRVAQRTQDNVA